MAALAIAAEAAPQTSRGEQSWKKSGSKEGEEGIERTLSEQECDLMIEALRRELNGIKVESRAAGASRTARFMQFRCDFSEPVGVADVPPG
jgi:hypothetical protein